ncbi:MAG: tRNA uridine-5-carboxymethylaminomethyl(34) synthesis GTPase MnmE [Desulfosalsimonas sp.]|uniref:tRNA uridine-5-carboxymethylaminomethyl(34) synthesis GTPase MnmE n=1 Tax=Desulfosalsimonas sp. TaxID=3073848 RepID=UPI0039709C28
MDSSTIAAVATPEGTGGIGVIRVSGPDAITAVAAVFRRAPFGQKPSDSDTDASGGFKSWRMYLGHIFDPVSGTLIDEVILAVMRAPYSYTREDVVEIQAHGGSRVLEKILNLLISYGIRPAQPGEFTRRAFINGRVDLTQAEAVADLINARSDASLDMAVSQMTGQLSNVVSSIRQSLVSVLGSLEAAIDFPEAAGDEMDDAGQGLRLSIEVLQQINQLREAYESGRFLRQGVQAVIIGRPNVGKSSLMNCLLNQQRAIVTEIAGTTRDCIEAFLTTRGVSMVVADTAGLRRDPDPIERLGIEKTQEYMASADIVLHVLDVSLPLDDEDVAIYEQLMDKPVVIVINKTDLAGHEKVLHLSPAMEEAPCMAVSALHGTGIDELKQRIADMVFSSVASAGHGFIPNWRQKCLLDQAAEAVSKVIAGLENQRLPELVSIDLHEAISAIDEITGKYVETDVLDEIFSRYCVGK